MRVGFGVVVWLATASACSSSKDQLERPDGSAADAQVAIGSGGGGANGSSGSGVAPDSGVGGPGRDGGAQACRALAAECQADSDCCAGPCLIGFDGLSVCGTRPICGPDGESCEFSVDCCEGGCAGGSCDPDTQCAALGSDCAGAADCCSGLCDNGTCEIGGGGCRSSGVDCTDNHNCCSGACKGDPLACEGDGPGCFVTGEPCTSDSACCSRDCSNDGRCARLDYCRPAGEPCSEPEQCCALLCSEGFCMPLLYCLPTYEPCETDVQCCTFRCDRSGTGPQGCLPIGGCRTSGYHQTSQSGDVSNEWGELCTRDEECCSGRCERDPENVARCRKRQGHPGQLEPEPICLPAGELCENDSHCCSRTCIQLREDPPVGPQYPKRCTDLDCDPRADPQCCRADGEGCADPAECCGDICLLHADGIYRCGRPPPPSTDAGTPSDGGDRPRDAGTPDGGSTCVPSGLDCTTDGDCCSSLRCVPYGARRICTFPLL